MINLQSLSLRLDQSRAAPFRRQGCERPSYWAETQSAVDASSPASCWTESKGSRDLLGQPFCCLTHGETEVQRGKAVRPWCHSNSDQVGSLPPRPDGCSDSSHSSAAPRQHPLSSGCPSPCLPPTLSRTRPLSFSLSLYICICVCVYIYIYGFPGGSAGKESACNAKDLGSIPGLGRSPGEGNNYPQQYSDLEHSMDCIVHGVTKSWTWLSDFRFHFHMYIYHFFLHSSIYGHLGCFHILAVINSAAVNIVLHVSFQIVFLICSNIYPGV